MVKPAVTIKAVHYTYPNAQKKALTNITLDIDEGDFIAIIGQTGSGKSTLVSLIDGLLQPTAGKLVVAGIEVSATTKPENLSKIHHHVGFVFQFPEQQLFAETVAEDIGFGPQNLGWSAEKIEAAVNGSLQMVGLPLSLKKKSPFALSGGQMRRVAIAGVLAMQPQILILDEPTAGLDTQAASELLQLVKKLNSKGITIIMVTHQMEQVAGYADRVIAMSNGEVLADTTPKRLFSNEKQLEKLSLTLPIPIEIAHSLKKTGVKLDDSEPLTLEKLADEIISVMRRKEDE